MKEITNPAAIKIKGLLFLFLGLLSAGLLVLERPSLGVAALSRGFDLEFLPVLLFCLLRH